MRTTSSGIALNIASSVDFDSSQPPFAVSRYELTSAELVVLLLELGGALRDLALELVEALVEIGLLGLFLDEALLELLALEGEAQHPPDLVEHALLLGKQLALLAVVADADLPLVGSADDEANGDVVVGVRLLAVFDPLVDGIDDRLLGVEHSGGEVAGELGEELADRVRVLDPLGDVVEAGELLDSLVLLPFLELAESLELVAEEDEYLAAVGLAVPGLERDRTGILSRHRVHGVRAVLAARLRHRGAEGRERGRGEDVLQVLSLEGYVLGVAVAREEAAHMDDALRAVHDEKIIEAALHEGVEILEPDHSALPLDAYRLTRNLSVPTSLISRLYFSPCVSGGCIEPVWAPAPVGTRRAEPGATRSSPVFQ